jgi:hypothetical protein
VINQQFSLRRILIPVAVLSLLLYYILTWVNMLGDLYKRTGSDFMGFYTFGRISQTQGFPSIYKIEEQQELQEEIVGHPVTPIFYTHLPFIAPIARVLVNEDYIESFRRWAVVLLLLNAINVTILVRTLDIQRLSKDNLILLILGAYLFDPTFSGLMNGQDTALLLLGAAIWVYGLSSRKYILSGLGLSLTTVRPQVALFLAIPFLFQHRRVFWSFALGSSILALVSMGLLGQEGTIRFIESIRYIESTVWQEAHALDMPTISGIIRRNIVLSNFESVQGIVWLFYLLGIAGFSAIWWKSGEIDEKLVGLLSIAAIFLAPYAHYHDLILLLIPVFCLICIYQKTGYIHQNYYSIIPLAVSWSLTLGFAGTGFLKFPIVYTIMVLMGYLLLKADKTPESLLPSPT